MLHAKSWVSKDASYVADAKAVLHDGMHGWVQSTILQSFSPQWHEAETYAC